MQLENKNEIVYQDTYRAHVNVHINYGLPLIGVLLSSIWALATIPPISEFSNAVNLSDYVVPVVKWLVYLIPAILVFTVSWKIFSNRAKKLDESLTIERKLTFNIQDQTLQMELVGIGGGNWDYDLQALTKTEDIPQQFTLGHGIRFIFTNATLKMQDLSPANRDKIKSMLADVLADEHRHVIDNRDNIIYQDHYRSMGTVIGVSLLGIFFSVMWMGGAVNQPIFESDNTIQQALTILFFVASGGFILYKSLANMILDKGGTFASFRTYRTIAFKDDELQIRLEGYEDKGISLYPLSQLKKTEIIKSRWKRCELVLSFETYQVVLKHLNQQNCTHIRSSIRSHIRDDDARQIDFEGDLEFDAH